MNLRKFFNLLSVKQKFRFVILIILTSVTVVLEVLSIGLIIPFVTAIINPEKLFFQLNNYFSIADTNIYNLIGENSNNLVLSMLIIFFIFFLLKNLFIFFTKYQTLKFIKYTEIDVSSVVLAKFLYQDLNFFLKNKSSTLISRLTNDVYAFSRIYLNSLLILFSEILIIFALLFLVIILSYTKVGIIFVICFLISSIFLKFTIKRSRLWGITRKEFDSKKIDLLKSIFRNIVNIILDNQYQAFKQSFAKIIKKLADTYRFTSLIEILPKMIFETIAVLSICIAVYFLFKNSTSQESIITTISFFLVMGYRLIPSIQKIIMNFQKLSYAKSGFESIVDIYQLDNKTKFSEKKYEFNKNFLLKDFSFRYEDNEIFKDTDFEIKKGQKIGILGNSGSGKSTLVDLITFLKKPNKGKIFIDEAEIISKEDERSWQNNISYLTQETVLLNDTIKKNIIFSRSVNNKIEDKHLNDCIDMAQLRGFVDGLPNKVETILNEESANISGGQKKRIAIARALYKNPSILIFDEATTGLDMSTEENILETIFSIKNSTIVFISHQKRLLEKCDLIFEINEKKIKLIK